MVGPFVFWQPRFCTLLASHQCFGVLGWLPWLLGLRLAARVAVRRVPLPNQQTFQVGPGCICGRVGWPRSVICTLVGAKA
jgi:hypothetical protein